MGNSGIGAKRKGRAKVCVSLKGMKRRCGGAFLDSGAHSLFNLHCFDHSGKKPVFKPPETRYLWYASEAGKLTKEYRAYMDEYARFLKKYKAGLDYYATVDAIYNPELSWKALKYLEKEHGLSPIPVIHHRTPLKWVDKHLAAGYEYIGLGGLGQQSTKAMYHEWADRVYGLLCANVLRIPCARTHGFAMTSYDLLIRYPWYSVDSSSVFKCAGNGAVYVPHKRDGKFTFAESPYVIGFSHKSTAKKDAGKHYTTLTKVEQRIVVDWLDVIGMKVGTVKDGEMAEYGVYSSYNARAVANLKFFEALCAWLPKWPWPFTAKARRGFFDWGTLK